MNVFSQQRTWHRAKRLSLSQLACLGRHTVTGLLCAGGRQFDDWSADYRLFSQDQWDAQQLFAPIRRGVLELSDPDMPFVAALDDTHIKKTGTHIPGVAWRRDPLSPPFNVNLIRAQRFIQLSAMLPCGETPASARAIPIRYEHSPAVPKPKHSASPEVWKAYNRQRRQNNLSTHALAILRETRQQLDRQHQCPQRQFVACVDGGYCNKTVLRGLPERTTLIGRIRKDAKLSYLPRDEDQPAIGAKRKYGHNTPTPEQLRQDLTVPWLEVSAFAAGKTHSFRVKTISPVLWAKAGADRPLRLVVIAPVGYRLRKGSKLLYRKPAYLICTDPNMPLEKILQYYIWRWDIEVNHRDEKQIIGVGQAQLRSERSVYRHPVFAVASYSMLLLAAARAYGLDATEGTLPLPKWRNQASKQRISTQKLIQQLRSEVWSYALEQLKADSNDFVSQTEANTKRQELQLPLYSTVLYASTG